MTTARRVASRKVPALQRDIRQSLRQRLVKWRIAMIKQAWAVWKGSLKDGSGTMSTETSVLKETPYGFKSRFESGPGTNPEELIGAAHAGCFSMALSSQLGQAGFTAEKIETRAAITFERVGDAFAINVTALQFDEIANKAKVGCPVSKVLNAKITMTAKLVV
jgi:osmotically inducible protein OsmC